MKAKLTDISIKNLQPKAKPYEVVDTSIVLAADGVDTRGLGVRVMPSGAKSFVMYKRMPGSKWPVRRSLGLYPKMSLAEARQNAHNWNRIIAKCLDPAIEEEKQRKADLAAKRASEKNTFGSAFEDYVERKLSKIRSGKEVERVGRKEFGSWFDRPLADISKADVKQAIASIEGNARAHYAYDVVRTFFNWIIDTGDFNFAVSPCDRLKATVLIGAKNVRERVLKDFEIAAYWRACEAADYPFGTLFKLLLLTALRRDEAADAVWGEFDLDAGLWTIPADRMKGKAAHVVPLVPNIRKLLGTVPRFVGGGFLFSTTVGRRPVSGFSKAKARLDAIMQADLEAQGKPFEGFQIHDIRRTVRTKLSALPIEDVVRERIMAHARPGLHRVYDQYSYLEEKAHALKLWHAKIRAITEPK